MTLRGGIVEMALDTVFAQYTMHAIIGKSSGKCFKAKNLAFFYDRIKGLISDSKVTPPGPTAS